MMDNDKLGKLTTETESSVEGKKEASYDKLIKEDTKKQSERKLKKSKAWYITITHLLTVGFTNFFIFVIFVFLIFPFIEIDERILQVFIYLLWVFGTWLGVIYSSKYLYKTYEISNIIKEKIIKLIIIFYTIIISLKILSNISNGFDINSIISFILAISLIVIFYYLSKKYIKTNI